ncbi:hypothetical protein C8D77_111115 [Mesorhizobium loti]|uniref:Uncharacterized protein n=1 Tax=Rhizobium loti TaxID=381 RepID=A0A8E3B3E9_RHILI|nr:hypothetical protein [Mesorhizobium loti]PWJ88392.1 hypothetical protein C8D77_111115 [Mesorhizobium loti]
MTKIDDGGPMFPTLAKVGAVAVSEGGMSKREYFAGQALAGLFAQTGLTIDIDGSRLGEKRAGVCVAMADALIAALEKPPFDPSDVERKVRYAFTDGASFPPASLNNIGDCRLAWVNEGDIGMLGKEIA